MPSWHLPPVDCPEKLNAYMQELLAQRGEEIEFVVLFGSVARGQGGELDLLVGLREDGSKRFVDRLREFSGLGPGGRALAYYPGELQVMRRQYHLVLLDAADHGVVLVDRGAWAELAAELRLARESGRLERISGGGWRVVQDAS